MKRKSLNHEDLKKVNQSTILNLILEKKLISKRELETLTGLTYATVGKLVGELIDYGLVKEAGVDTSVKRLGGPNPVLVSLADGPPYIVAVHIGVTIITVGLVSMQGEIIDSKGYEIDAAWTSDFLVKEIAHAVDDIIQRKKLSRQQDILAVGLAVGGIVNSDDGIIYWHELELLRNVPIRDILQTNIGKPVFIDNIVEALAIGEAKYGKAKLLESFAYLLVGGFVGGAIVENGRNIHGKRHMAGQIGHTIVDEYGPQCSCGRSGCIQAIVSNVALIKQVKELLNQGKANILKTIIRSSEEITKGHVVQAAGQGDEDSRRLLEYLGCNLGKCVADIVNLVDPEEVIIAYYVDGHHYKHNKSLTVDKIFSASKAVISEFEEKALLKSYTENLAFPKEAPHIRFINIQREHSLIGAHSVAITNLFSSQFDFQREINP